MVRAGERRRMEVYSRFREEAGGHGGVAGIVAEERIPQTWIVGNVDHCVAELAAFIREYGLTDIVTWAVPPGMRPEQMNHSLERFARDVAPAPGALRRRPACAWIKPCKARACAGESAPETGNVVNSIQTWPRRLPKPVAELCKTKPNSRRSRTEGANMPRPCRRRDDDLPTGADQAVALRRRRLRDPVARARPSPRTTLAVDVRARDDCRRAQGAGRDVEIEIERPRRDQHAHPPRPCSADIGARRRRRWSVWSACSPTSSRAPSTSPAAFARRACRSASAASMSAAASPCCRNRRPNSREAQATRRQPLRRRGRGGPSRRRSCATRIAGR